MTRRLIAIGSFAAAACCGAVIVLGAAAVSSAAPTAAPQKPPAWTPDKAQLSQLAPPATVGSFEIRPPIGYASQNPQGGLPGTTATAWVGAARPDGTQPYMMVVLMTPPPEEADKYTPAQVMEKLLGAVARRRTQWKETQPESGTINGWPFVRAYWQGTDTASGHKMRGFSYVARFDGTFVQISSQDVEPYDKSALTLAEASARTLRKR